MVSKFLSSPKHHQFTPYSVDFDGEAENTEMIYDISDDVIRATSFNNGTFILGNTTVQGVNTGIITSQIQSSLDTQIFQGVERLDAQIRMDKVQYYPNEPVFVEVFVLNALNRSPVALSPSNPSPVVILELLSSNG